MYYRQFMRFWYLSNMTAAKAQRSLRLSPSYVGRNERKPVFGVSDEVSLKPACSDTVTS